MFSINSSFVPPSLFSLAPKSSRLLIFSDAGGKGAAAGCSRLGLAARPWMHHVEFLSFGLYRISLQKLFRNVQQEFIIIPYSSWSGVGSAGNFFLGISHQIVVGTGVTGRLAGAGWPSRLTLTDAHSESWGLGWAWQMAPLIGILHVAGASHGVVSEF